MDLTDIYIGQVHCVHSAWGKSCTLLFASKYRYTGFSVIEEDNREDFTYSNITSISPLTTEYLHYLFEIPDESVKRRTEDGID